MEVWKDSKHAHAFESLFPENKRHGYERLHGVSRGFDPECLACHVTGWKPEQYLRYRSGFLNEELAEEPQKNLQSLLAGNQCENCHGPGSRHIELIEEGEVQAALKEVKVTQKQALEGMCTGAKNWCRHICCCCCIHLGWKQFCGLPTNPDKKFYERQNTDNLAENSAAGHFKAVLGGP